MYHETDMIKLPPLTPKEYHALYVLLVVENEISRVDGFPIKELAEWVKKGEREVKF